MNFQKGSKDFLFHVKTPSLLALAHIEEEMSPSLI